MSSNAIECLVAAVAALSKESLETAEAQVEQAKMLIEKQAEQVQANFDEAAEKAVKTAAQEFDFTEAIEDALSNYDFSDAIEKPLEDAVENIDLSDAASEAIQEVIDNGALDDTIKSAVEHEVESQVEDAISSANIEQQIENEVENAVVAVKDDLDRKHEDLDERLGKVEATLATFAPLLAAINKMIDAETERRVAASIEAMGGKPAPRDAQVEDILASPATEAEARRLDLPVPHALTVEEAAAWNKLQGAGEPPRVVAEEPKVAVVGGGQP